jgi:hypothetical protein
MPTPKRVTPWHTLSIAQGNVIQISGLLGAAVLAWYAGQKRVCGTRWMVASRLGINFTGYGLHGTSHSQLYPPGMRWVFSHLPFLSARIDPASLRAASPAARAAMYAAGTVGTVIPSVMIPGYLWWRGVPRTRGFFIGTNLWNVPLLLSESLRQGGDLRRAWQALRERSG